MEELDDYGEQLDVPVEGGDVEKHFAGNQRMPMDDDDEDEEGIDDEDLKMYEQFLANQ